MKIENIKYIDCHSHPHDERYEKEDLDVDKFLEDLKQDGGATIAIGTDYENSLKAISLSNRHENVWAAIGIHPADRVDIDFDESKFNEMRSIGKVVAIGECGLDYFYFDKLYVDLTDVAKQEKISIEKTRQKNIFIKQIEYAIKHDLPLVLHGRPSKGSMDAYKDILFILEDFKNKNLNTKGHAHFFVGDIDMAKRFLDLGFLLSFDGPITFATEYDEVIKCVPIESMMIETDSPYAAPRPYRGQINYPIYVKEVAQKIAILKNISLDTVLKITKDNAIKLFKLQ